MTEQWEHMIVQAELSQDGGQLFAYFAGRAKTLLDNRVTNSVLLTTLNELGAQGWQLVGTDSTRSAADGRAAQTYFLKRALEGQRLPDLGLGL